MRVHWLALCVVLLNIIAIGHTARILLILPFVSKSHFMFSSFVMRALTNRGHHVVAYGPLAPANPISNYTHVEVHTAMEELRNQWTYEDFLHVTVTLQPAGDIEYTDVWGLTYSTCEQFFQHEKIKKLLNSNEQFDLVVTESFFGQESMLVFGHKFKAPTITLGGFGVWTCINRVAGNSLSIASVPHFPSTLVTIQMSIKDRAINYASALMSLYKFYNLHLPIHQKIISENYPGEAPPIEDLITNVSLFIMNSHFTTEYTQPYSPNIIQVAGITLTQERNTLTQDIQKFMDDAKEGVIYFSFGTVIPLHVFPREILQIFMNVFKKINYKVIWIIELENIPGLPSNVILRKWVPQTGILAHPNLALFLTHGGLNSQLEAIHAGVPTVSIPFFGDQPYNARFNEYHGIGLKVDYKTLSEETLMSALTKVLYDTRYKENTQKMSRIFLDRPMSPEDTVVFWTEYVLRHAGARHLQPAGAWLTWYQLLLLDVAAIVIAGLSSLMFICYIVVRKVLFAITGKRRVTSCKKD